MNTSLYVIEDSLQQLADLREQAESEGDSEALKVIDDQLADYLTQQADKVSSYVGLIRLREDQAANCDAELERVKALRDRARADVERLKATALAVMQRFDVKALKDERTGSALTRRGNGGLQALEVDEAAVPDDFKFVTVTFSLAVWKRLQEEALNYHKEGAIMVDNEMVRKALAQRVRCPECAEYQDTARLTSALAMKTPSTERTGSALTRRGNGGLQALAIGRDLIARDPCPRCNGAGTIQNTVPGARLLERGEHVRLS